MAKKSLVFPGDFQARFHDFLSTKSLNNSRVIWRKREDSFIFHRFTFDIFLSDLRPDRGLNLTWVFKTGCHKSV